MLGLSGGIDSALVAYLVAEAIGAERLLCVLMPYRTSSPASRADAEEVVAAARLRERAGRHQPDGRRLLRADDAGAAAGRLEPPLRRGNFMARMRMAVLYDRSVTWGGLVVGTGNKTESLIGYTTLFGDNACAFNPIGDLYKSQVRQLAAAIGVPEAIIRKAPSADLWPGQTDETEGGFSYPSLDRLLFWRVDKRRSIEEIVALGFEPAIVERVDRMVAGAEFKRQVPPIAKLGPRTAGVDYLYPRRRPGSGPRVTRRAGAAAGGTLYVVATPIGNLGDVTLRALEVLRGGAADRGRGHAAHPPAARPPRDRDADDQLPRPERPGARGRAARRTCAAARDLALVTDAGTPGGQRPGRRSWSPPGRRRAGAVVPIPGASAVLAAVAARGVAGPRWAFEGFLPRSRPRAARAAGPDRRRRAGRRSLFEAPGPASRRRSRDLAAACGADRPGAVCRELTKLHEEIVRGTLGELADAAADGDDPARAASSRSSSARGRSRRPASTEAMPPRDAPLRPRAEVERLVAAGIAARRRRPTGRGGDRACRGGGSTAAVGPVGFPDDAARARPRPASRSSARCRRSARIVGHRDRRPERRRDRPRLRRSTPTRRCSSSSRPRRSSAWPGSSACRPSGSARSPARRSAASSTRRSATSPS